MTYESCILSKADKVIIATDDQSIVDRAKEFTDSVEFTSSSHKTWSDRVAEIAERFPEYDIVLNIQWDEPLVSQETVNQLIDSIVDAPEDVVMCTAMTKFLDITEVTRPHNVKVVYSAQNIALYFSRSVIPFDRNANLSNTSIQEVNYRKHLWLYAYKRKFLLEYVKMEQTFLEKMESLEQLRILENWYRIRMVETNHDSIWIDTLEDLDKLNLYLSTK